METECDVRPKATRLTAPPSVLQTSVIQRKLIHFSLPASYHKCDSSACWVADTNARITQPRPSSLSGRPKSNSQARYQTEQPGAVIPIGGRSSIKGQKDSPKAPEGSYTKRHPNSGGRSSRSTGGGPAPGYQLARINRNGPASSGDCHLSLRVIRTQTLKRTVTSDTEGTDASPAMSLLSSPTAEAMNGTDSYTQPSSAVCTRESPLI